MSEPFVVVDKLARAFGQVRAVREVTFALQAGEVAGLIGANGAGKTTTMRILATLDLPDAGTVRIGGVDIVDHPSRVRAQLGWMPDHFTPYKDTTVGDYLDFFGRAQGLSGRELELRLGEVMDFTDLTPLSERPLEGLSKGQAQRVCLGRTLINDPRFLILDEPAAGLDPKARLEFKNLVRILRAQGRTLLISSHILTELGEMCDTLIFMDAGRVVHHGDKESLQRRHETEGQAYEITVLGEVAALVARLELEAGWRVLDVRRDGVRAECARPEPTEIAATLRRLCAELPVVEFRREERRLEEAFVDMLRQPAGRGGSVPPLPAAAAGGQGHRRLTSVPPLSAEKTEPVLKLKSRTDTHPGSP